MIGPTGIIARVDIGVKVTVTGTQQGSPAEGKFKEKELITGVNGQPLAGYSPFVILGNAITAAEASDGKLVFDVESTTGKRKEAVQIPVMGAYGKNWPVDCPKSRKIIDNAASYYANLLKTEKNGGIGGALACLFLLSTGDDQYLPLIKTNYQGMIDAPKKIGDHTWNNGYNGIACAEYYLRTGDKDMLPVLQAFCDDVRITGAPRSKYAKEFQLPTRIWGKKADLEFLKITPVEGFETFGKTEPTPIRECVAPR